MIVQTFVDLVLVLHEFFLFDFAHFGWVHKDERAEQGVDRTQVQMLLVWSCYVL